MATNIPRRRLPRSMVVALLGYACFAAAFGCARTDVLYKVSEAPADYFGELWSYKGQPKGVRSVAFSANGKTLAALGRDYTARIIDVETGRQITFFGNYGNFCWKTRFIWFPVIFPFCALVPFGPMAVGSMWITSGDINAMAISPDGQLAATSGDYIRVWSARTGQQKKVIQDTTSASSVALEFTSDIKRLCSIGYKHVVMYDLENGKAIWSVKLRSDDNYIKSGQIMPDGQSVFVLTYSNIVCIFNSVSGELIRQIQVSPHEGRFLISRNGKRMLCAQSNAISEIDLETGQTLRTYTIKQRPAIQLVSWSSDERQVVLNNYWNGFSVFDLESNKILCKFLGTRDVRSQFAVSPDGNLVAYSHVYDGKFSLKLSKLPKWNSSKSE